MNAMARFNPTIEQRAITCWLCRAFGHKWVTRTTVRVGDLKRTKDCIWGCCLRCGEPTPEAIADQEATA